MSSEIAEHQKKNLTSQLQQLSEAGPLTKQEQAKKLASAIDVLITKEGGIELIYDNIVEIISAGFFDNTNWEDTQILNSSLVGGTLKFGSINTVYEVVSELRLLGIAEGKITDDPMSKEAARDFLEELTVTNLDLLFPDASEELRNVDKDARKRIDVLFGFLRDRFIDWDRISKRLAEELDQICSQRPVVVSRAKFIIRTVRQQLTDRKDEQLNEQLQFYIDALFAPSPEAKKLSEPEYEEWLKSEKVSSNQLASECDALSEKLRKSGISSPYHALMLRRVKDDPALIQKLLGLNAHGQAELELYHEKVSGFVDFACHPDTNRMVYGLTAMLERSLLSRQPVLSGLDKLYELELHPEVSEKIKKAKPHSSCTPEQHLFADTICILGQPLGVGQGWNPTCQSARGMSLWSRHDPGKLLGMIDNAATTNDLEMRFEGQILKASQLAEGLAKDFDYNLDSVSIVLVPHLDRIYFEMMNRAAARGEDPHKWVNPAMYGQWIHTGFSTPYNYLTNTISGYEDFLRLFYATHHPQYNGGHDLAYPNPVGIFLTAANGKLLGFHAVSILRVAEHKGEYRLYFLNPNNEGRQKWQSDIQPTVAGNGEVPGESSLPFYQFASRLYAFHYNPADADGADKVDSDEIQKVTEISKNSWGKSYTWQDAVQPPVFPSLI